LASSILVEDETKLKAELQQLGASGESRITICDAPELSQWRIAQELR
jgi:hypothetical protein